MGGLPHCTWKRKERREQKLWRVRHIMVQHTQEIIEYKLMVGQLK